MRSDLQASSYVVWIWAFAVSTSGSIDRRSFMQSDVRKTLFLEQGMIGDDKDFFTEGLREVEGH